MRATIHLGLVCVTIAFCAFLKYFAGPVTLQKEQQDFTLNLLFFGKDRIQIKPKQEKINQESRKTGTIEEIKYSFSGIRGSWFPDSFYSFPDPDSPPEL